MYKQLLVLAIAAATATTGWTSETGETKRASKQEAVGLGSGAVIGAAAGGPVGFVVGAALGGWLGDRLHDERSGRIEAETRVAQVSAEARELERLLARNERETERVMAQLEAERSDYARSLEEALNVQVYFRTAEASLDEGSAERLARIGELVRSMDGVAVLLEGHADKRGDETYNVELSEQRAQFVRQVFVDAGVPAERIAVSAEGEADSTAPADDVDALALERRVEISIVGPGEIERVAQRAALD